MASTSSKFSFAAAKLQHFFQTTKKKSHFLVFLGKKMPKMTKKCIFFEKNCANVCKFQKKVVTLHRFSKSKVHLIYIYVHI